MNVLTRICAAGLTLALCAAPALAQTPDIATTSPLVELSARATGTAANDLASATAYAEHTAATPQAAAAEVNQRLAAAFEAAKKHPAIKAQNADVSTYPVYNSAGSKVTGWRMRAGIALESSDTTALATLLGELQQTLSVGNLTLRPAPHTYDVAADAIATQAIAAFQARAKNVAAALSSDYRIKTLSLDYGSGPSIQPPFLRARAMSAESSPVDMPVEAGESAITVTVSGSIELIK